MEVLSMRNGNERTMEFRNVNYADVPRVIKKMLLNGFALDDICKVKVNGCNYDVMARKVGA